MNILTHKVIADCVKRCEGMRKGRRDKSDEMVQAYSRWLDRLLCRNDVLWRWNARKGQEKSAKAKRTAGAKVLRADYTRVWKATN